MPSVEVKFGAVLDELQHPSASHYAGDKLIFYVTFPANELLSVKRQVPLLQRLAEHRGWSAEVLSAERVLTDFFAHHPYRLQMLEQEAYVEPTFQGIAGVFEDLGSSVRHEEVLAKALLARQNELAARRNALLLVTDLECLHPYSRFGPIEQQVYTRLLVPLVVLYPGRLSGSSLEFLDLYPPDGSYRSKHY